MGENRHGNLGTYSRDGNGDTPLLSRRHRLLVRLALLELASRSLECGGDQHVQLQVEDGSMRAQRGLVWDGIFANFERSGRVRVSSHKCCVHVCRLPTRHTMSDTWIMV